MRHCCLRCEGTHPARNCFMSKVTLYQGNDLRGPRVCLPYNAKDGEGCKVHDCPDIHMCTGCGAKDHSFPRCKQLRTISMNYQSRPNTAVDNYHWKCCLHCLGAHALIQCMNFTRQPFAFCYYYNAEHGCENPRCGMWRV